MKTILEIFYLRVVGKDVRYQRKLVNLSRKGGDPDRAIRSLIRQKERALSGKVIEKEFIVHSTSWRYEPPDKVLLTYVAYSEELEFKKGTYNCLSLKRLPTIHKNSRKPSSKTELEKKVVSHAMRHIAFLIQSGDRDGFKSALKADTVLVFKKLWISLAGKVF